MTEWWILIELNPYATEIIFLTPFTANTMQFFIHITIRLTYIRGLIFEFGRDFPIGPYWHIKRVQRSNSWFQLSSSLFLIRGVISQRKLWRDCAYTCTQARLSLRCDQNEPMRAHITLWPTTCEHDIQANYYLGQGGSVMLNVSIDALIRTDKSYVRPEKKSSQH